MLASKQTGCRSGFVQVLLVFLQEVLLEKKLNNSYGGENSDRQFHRKIKSIWYTFPFAVFFSTLHLCERWISGLSVLEDWEEGFARKFKKKKSKKNFCYRTVDLSSFLSVQMFFDLQFQIAVFKPSTHQFMHQFIVFVFFCFCTVWRSFKSQAKQLSCNLQQTTL